MSAGAITQRRARAASCPWRQTTAPQPQAATASGPLLPGVPRTRRRSSDVLNLPASGRGHELVAQRAAQQLAGGGAREGAAERVPARALRPAQAGPAVLVEALLQVTGCRDAVAQLDDRRDGNPPVRVG